MPLIINQKAAIPGCSAYGIPDISKLAGLIGVFDFHPDNMELDTTGKIAALIETTGKGIRLPLLPQSVPPEIASTIEGVAGYDRCIWPPSNSNGAAFGPVPSPNNTTITAAIITSRPSKPTSNEYHTGWNGTTNCLYTGAGGRHLANWRGAVAWAQNHTAYGDGKPEYMIFRGDNTRASIVTETSNEEVAITNTGTLAALTLGSHYTSPTFGACWRTGAIYTAAFFSTYLADGSRDMELLREWCKSQTVAR